MERNVREREFEARNDVSKPGSKALPQRARRTLRFHRGKAKPLTTKDTKVHEGKQLLLVSWSQVGFCYAIVPGELIFVEEGPGIAEA